MSRFEVDSEAMAGAATAVQGSIATVTAETQRMMHNLEALQATWRGQAATSFATVTGEWRATQQRVHETLQAIQAALTHAGRQYAEVEAATVRMFAS
ncbi:MAG: WXG100 family type VII secretion target [Kineosporiaceae bacterium]